MNFCCRCQTLDVAADGYVRAEGCGSIMLQGAADLQEDNTALAFIHAAAVNQDGRSSSLTAPNGPSQQAVIRQALQAAALEPHLMHALQMHGTGMCWLVLLSWFPLKKVTSSDCQGTLHLKAILVAHLTI